MIFTNWNNFFSWGVYLADSPSILPSVLNFLYKFTKSLVNSVTDGVLSSLVDLSQHCDNHPLTWFTVFSTVVTVSHIIFVYGTPLWLKNIGSQTKLTAYAEFPANISVGMHPQLPDTLVLYKTVPNPLVVCLTREGNVVDHMTYVSFRSLFPVPIPEKLVAYQEPVSTYFFTTGLKLTTEIAFPTFADISYWSWLAVFYIVTMPIRLQIACSRLWRDFSWEWTFLGTNRAPLTSSSHSGVYTMVSEGVSFDIFFWIEEFLHHFLVFVNSFWVFYGFGVWCCLFGVVGFLYRLFKCFKFLY